MLAARGAAAVRGAGRRHLATAVETPFKITAVDNGQATASVTLVVKAGSRYETTPGAAHVLKNFAFKGTDKRSALRTVRESELYGGVLSATLGREHLALTADFLKGDEEYFVDVLSGVLTGTTFSTHELHEVVAPQVEAEATAASSDPATIALDAAYTVAFRNGLGNPLLASSPVSLEAVKAYAAKTFTKENVAVIGSGLSEASLAKLVSSKLSSLPSGAASSETATKYYGGESRVNAHTPPTLFIGFGTAEPSAALNVLAAHLDPTPALKWTDGTGPLSASKVGSGVSVQVVHDTYSDGALVGVLISGAEVADVTAAGKAAVAALKGAADGSGLKADGALTKALAKAKFTAASALESGRELSAAVLGYKLFATPGAAVEALDGVTAADVAKAAKTLTAGKATYVAVGNVGQLPYADELGL